MHPCLLPSILLGNVGGIVYLTTVILWFTQCFLANYACAELLVVIATEIVAVVEVLYI